ncbi:sugar ABC transporter permease [Labedella populi]|uniref:Sugar ABC transporter permease n=2 Tax=Labedella populi TaxID=2498850 RepID=A0A3S4AF30_9MICO|nr:sugar ABC transporter permease [Labedella populi]
MTSVIDRLGSPAATGLPGPPASPRIPRKRRRRIAAAAMVAPTVAGLLVFYAYPLVASIYYSFTSYDLFSPPRWVGLTNYEFLFTSDPRIGNAALNTLWFVVVLVPIKIVVALAIAGLLARRTRGSGFWRTVFYLPSLVPPVAGVVAFVFLFNPGSGPVNVVLGFFGIEGPLWFSDPALSKPSLVLLGIWMMGDLMVIMLAGLLDVPRELYEAASLDGANGWQQVRFVTLPTIQPILGFSVVTGVIAALQYFTEAAVASSVASGQAAVGSGTASTLGYPGDSLLTYTQWLYVRGFSNYQLGYASAMAVVLFVTASILLVVAMRRISAFHPEEVS